MAKLFWELTQGSKEWYSIRQGIPTASLFDHVMTPTKMQPSERRQKYAARLIAERLLNWQPDSLDKIDHIMNGKINEPFAVAQIEEIYEIETRPIGHITTNDGRFGASPDRVTMKGDAVDITLEVKCPTLPVQFGRLIFGDDESYKCQRQGQLWVAEADKAIYYSYTSQTPAFRVETGRDEPFIAKLVDCLERFSDELEAWTAKAKSLGAYQKFAELVTPIDAERGDQLRYAPASDEEIEDLVNGPTSKRYDWGG